MTEIVSSSLHLGSVHAQVDFSKPTADTNSPYTLHNGAQILSHAPNGVSQALRIDKDGPYALITGVDIGPRNMPNCTLMIGIYLESIANNRGWVFGHERYGYDRTIMMHDSRSGGGISSAVGKLWQPWTSPQSPPTKEWLHVTAVFRQGGESYVYMNGVRSDNVVISNSNGGYKDIWIGRARWSDHWADSWIKEVKVFDEALSDEDVLRLSNQFFTNVFWDKIEANVSR